MNALPWALQQERHRCVVADAARKCSAHKWTGRGLPVPESLLRRETVEFDILHGLVPPPAPPAAPAPPVEFEEAPQFEEGSSSGSWILSTTASSPHTLVQAREVAMDEDGFEIYDPAAFESSVTREDFVPDEVLATVTSAMQARSEDEVQDDAKRRRREVDINTLLLKQGLEQDRLHREQEASKAREKGKAVVIYADDSDKE